MTTTLRLLPHGLRAQLQESAEEYAGQRVREAVVYSGAAVEWLDWSTGEVVDLVFDLATMHLSRLNAGAPVLDRHQQGSIRDQLGVVERARVSGGRAVALLRFSRRADVEPIWEDIEDGIIRNVSMGLNWARVAMEDRTPKNSQRRKYLVRESEPFEISLVPANADPGAQFLAMGEAEKAALRKQAYTVVVRGGSGAGAHANLDRARSEIGARCWKYHGPVTAAIAKGRLWYVRALQADARKPDCTYHA